MDFFSKPPKETQYFAGTKKIEMKKKTFFTQRGLSKNSSMVSLKKFETYIVHKVKNMFNNVCKFKLTQCFLKTQFFKRYIYYIFLSLTKNIKILKEYLLH